MGFVSVSTHSGSEDVLARLKLETRADHERLEAALDLTSDRLDRGAYLRCLERLHGYFAPLEAGITAVGGWRERGVDLDARRRSSMLEADLSALGQAPAVVPRCRELYLPTEPAGAFGALYVLEGSSLGGRVIARRLRDTLGIGPESGARFFHGYGDRTGEMWRSFRAALTAYARASGDHQRIVVGAARTFAGLCRWFEIGESRDGP